MNFLKKLTVALGKSEKKAEWRSFLGFYNGCGQGIPARIFFLVFGKTFFQVREKFSKDYDSIPSPSRKMIVVAPIVMMSPSEMRILSLGPNISFIKKVPVLLNPSRKV